MSPLDLQVNGYAGVDFNGDDLAAGDLHAACAALRDDGTGAILATIITDAAEKMTARLDRLAELRAADPLVASVIAGLHVEGPFISPEPGYVGAHPVEHVRRADAGFAERLVEAGGGLVKLVTLAPEQDPGFAVTKHLAARGIAVSAGHCDPSLDQLRGALDSGLSMFTHLGNGCPAHLPRHDNIVQRALSLADRMWITFIPDGAHIDFFALRNYLRAAGTERVIMVSDAISAARLGPGSYTLASWTLDIGTDLVARAPGGDHLVGSTLTMPRIRENLGAALGLSPGEIEQVIAVNPRRALGMDEV
ncbi:MAG: N-acetylglucosamine-6-phosphate deacetylase [Akkermansiaceae bacterium]|nr:N-acetylglucosamine-6-phosphate deacetylase [Akkermansiaceae bacterium]